MRHFAVLVLLAGCDAGALQVWSNQVGFDTRGVKRFRAVAPTDYGRVSGTFEVLNASNAVVQSGPMAYQGDAWGSHFWLGDFSALVQPGTYRIRVRLGSDQADSYAFAVGNDLPLRAAAKLLIQFFYTQRCGYVVPGWHALCHTDDGQLPSGVRKNFTGGWHDAGDYGKFTGGYHPMATHSLLEAYERRHGFFDTFDEIEANGVPDILEEAIWGIGFESRMTEATGNVLARTEKVRSGSSFVIPEADTDRIVGTSDDRRIRDDVDGSGAVVPNGQAVLVASNLSRLYRILSQRGGSPQPDPAWLAQAEAIWAYYLTKGSGGLPWGEGPGVINAATNLFLATGKQQYRTAADQMANAYAQAVIGNPGLEDTDVGRGGWGIAALVTYVERFPAGSAAAAARQAIQSGLDHLANTMAANPVGLLKRKYYGADVYFVGPPNPPDGWLRLGQNSGYLTTAHAAYLGAALTGEARYITLAADQLNWVYGGNPQRWCMVHGLGTDNPKGYHHRYAYIVGHLDGAVPGAVLNGYARSASALSVDSPWIDTRTNTELVIGPYRSVTVADFVTNEPWLPNNAGLIMAIATQPYTPVAPPQPDGGLDAGPDAGPNPNDAGANDAGGNRDAGGGTDAGPGADAGVGTDAGGGTDSGSTGRVDDAGAAADPDGFVEGCLGCAGAAGSPWAALAAVGVGALASRARRRALRSPAS